MNIVIVTRDPLPGPQHIESLDDDIWLRSALIGLRSLSAGVLVLGPGITDEQRETALRCMSRGLVIDLDARVKGAATATTHSDGHPYGVSTAAVGQPPG